MFGHEPFEDFLNYAPGPVRSRCASSDAIDVITPSAGTPNAPAAKADSFEVHLTDALTQQLAHRRVDLGATNRDRLSDLDDTEPIPADLLAEVTADRNAAATLDRLISAYTVARARTA